MQKKKLQEILEKVFITKKCTQRKILHTLKTDVFESPDNKNIGKLFSECEVFSLDLANFSSNPSQILILLILITNISEKSYPSHVKSLFNTILIMCSSSVSLFYPNTFHNYWINQTICQPKPIKFIINLYANRNTLLVKRTTHQKAESLRAASLSKLANTENNISIFNAKCAEFSTKW